MTLISTETGVVGFVRKVADQDEGAAQVLVRLGVYEAMCDLTDALRPEYEERIAKFVSQRSEEGRRALVRSYIDRRARGEDVEDVLKAASLLTLTEVSKSGGVVDADPTRPGNLGRDTRTGRFASLRSGSSRAAGGMNVTREGLEQMGSGKARAVQGLGEVLTRNGEPAIGSALIAAGKLGPEAERVLGPSMQRAAYRYRGTERRPSSGLMSAVYGAPGGEGQGQRMSPAMAGALQHYQGPAGQGMSREQKRLAVQGDSVAAYFRSQLPSQEQAELSLASGRVPPSRGAIIDADGDVVSEAVGMNGDHYVPFDLRNLGRLEGGQYVRTRAAGGPTREDIYTGLLSGARQVQVVSHSGVFTLELDPSLRGSRRYSDKARQMVNRYQELLQAVESGQVAEVDLDAETKATLRRKAFDMTNSPQEARTKYSELVQAKIADESFLREEEDDDELEEAAENRVATFERQQGKAYAPSERRKMVAEVKAKLRQEGHDQTPRALRLDGEGYRRALDSLQAEFPYFIRDVRHETLRDFEANRHLDVVSRQPGRGPGDRGFVARGNNLAAASAREDRAVRSRSMVAGRTTERRTEAPANPAESEAEAPRAQEGQQAPAARSAASDAGVPTFTPRELDDRSPRLDQVLQSPQGEVLRDQALDAMNDLLTAHQDLEAMLPATAALPDYAKWTEKDLKGKRPVHVLAFLTNEEKVGDNALTWLLTKAKPETRQAVREALSQVPAATRDFQDEDYAEQVNQAAQEIVDLLDFADPFGPPPTTEAMFKIPTSADKPFAFKQIIDLGTSSKNFDGWAERASASDDDMRDFLENGVPTAMVGQAIQLRARLREQVERGGHDVDDAKVKLEAIEKQIPKMHLARAFFEAREKVDQWERSAGAAPFEEAEKSASPSRSQRLLPGRRHVRKSVSLTRQEHRELLVSMALEGRL